MHASIAVLPPCACGSVQRWASFPAASRMSAWGDGVWVCREAKDREATVKTRAIRAAVSISRARSVLRTW